MIAHDKLLITAEELKNCKSRVKLVDVREPEEHVEYSIDGDVLISMGELMQRAPKELKQADSIVLYCAHGIRSLQAALMLKHLGFEDVKSLVGGVEAWQRLEFAAKKSEK